MTEAPAVKINAEDRQGAAAVLAYSAALVWLGVHQAPSVRPDVRTEAFQLLAAQPKLWKEFPFWKSTRLPQLDRN